ncbi:MAG: alpha/beta fold hydrolase [bacterium]|nr:alpha/beta fold hydrolase [bacterium]
MIENFFNNILSKENLAITGVVILFLWRVIDSFIKLHKKGVIETDNMAFDLAKAKLSNRSSHDFPLLTYFFMYRKVLKSKLNFHQGYVNWLAHKEEELDRKIDQLTFLNRTLEEKDSGRAPLPTWRSVYYDIKYLFKIMFEKKRYKIEKVFVQNKKNEKLAGLRDLPTTNRGKYPTVVLVHGFGANKTEYGMFDDLAKRLASNGYQVYRFDFAGLGESEGSYSFTTLSKQAEDLEGILDFVKTQPTTDNFKLGLVGMSLGTAVITAFQPKNVRALVYLGSVSEPHKTLKELFGTGYNPDGMSVRITSEEKRVEIYGDFWKDFDNYNLPDLIKNIKAPILFIHGEKDSKVGVESAQLYFDNANTPKDLKIVKNADHGFYEPDERKEMIDLTESWFDKYLLY